MTYANIAAAFNKLITLCNPMKKHKSSLKYHLVFRSQRTDHVKRQKYALKELNTIVLKAIIENSSVAIDPMTQEMADAKLQKFKPNSITKIRNRCIISGKSSTIAPFRVSRIILKELASFGKVPGLSKALNR